MIKALQDIKIGGFIKNRQQLYGEKKSIKNGQHLGPRGKKKTYKKKKKW